MSSRPQSPAIGIGWEDISFSSLQFTASDLRSGGNGHPPTPHAVKCPPLSLGPRGSGQAVEPRPLCSWCPCEGAPTPGHPDGRSQQRSIRRRDPVCCAVLSSFTESTPFSGGLKGAATNPRVGAGSVLLRVREAMYT